MAYEHTTEQTENIRSAFVAGAMWAAADLAIADMEAITLFERASAVPREDYGPDYEADIGQGVRPEPADSRLSRPARGRRRA